MSPCHRLKLFPAPPCPRPRSGSSRTQQKGSLQRLGLKSLSLVFACLGFGAQHQAHAQACPDLSALYSQIDSQIDGAQTDDATNWQQIERQLAPLMSRCLQSSEYFALLGAAQMNVGRLAEALESLERALLLEPGNGAAQIDYALALYLQGQIFSALELNRLLMQRNDLPEDLQPLLQERQRNWGAMTRQTSFQTDVLLGYDTNLNGAPSPSQITLTLSGDSVVLPLNPEYRPKAGPYTNLRLAGRYRQLAPEHQHNLIAELRGRVSEDADSDLLQFDTRYAFIKPGRERSWQFVGGMSHLFFGGSPLYTATELGGRYVPSFSRACRPYVSAATQHQLFHDQSTLTAVESKAGVGFTCPLDNGMGRHQLTTEISALNNTAIKDSRPGGDRNGWQVSFDWQVLLDSGVISSQFSHTHLDDSRGYNPLLNDNAERWVGRSYLLLQYRRPMGENSQLMVNVYRQHQRSNLDLFRSSDSSIEFGVSHSF